MHADANKIRPTDRPVHDWYRFVLSYPPHLVREYLERFQLTNKHRVLDPFCGTGTTLVECKKRGIASIGIEANPMAHLACRVKTDWTVDAAALLTTARQIAADAEAQLHAAGCRTLPAELHKLLLKNSISPLPLHKTLVLRDGVDSAPELLKPHLQVALARAIVFSISNLHFGPEVGVGKLKHDCLVIAPWLEEVRRMADDLRGVADNAEVPSAVHQGDARELSTYLQPCSLDAVITSPPYPNEKDYTRTTRLESVLLGLIRSKDDLRALKRSMVRSNTRSVYKTDEDDVWVASHARIQKLAASIEARRLQLGKTSGFERLYARVTRLYFGGMRRHLASLRPFLRPGARLAYVVGDQASYLRVLIRTGRLLADLAKSLGYEVVALDTFRKRLATATRSYLREEVLVLRWPG